MSLYFRDKFLVQFASSQSLAITKFTFVNLDLKKVGSANAYCKVAI